MKKLQKCTLRIAAVLVATSISAGALAAAGPNLINGGSFDSAADIAFWTPGLNSLLAFSTSDAQGSMGSGSMQVSFAPPPGPQSVPGGLIPSASATQCIASVTASSYNFGTSIMGGIGSEGSMTCSAFTGVIDCSGTAATSARTAITTTGEDFTWVTVTSSLTVAVDGSVLCELDFYNLSLKAKGAQAPTGFGPAADFDDVFFQNPVPVGLQSFDVQ